MNYTIENHASDRVILLTAAPGFSIRQEVQAAITEVEAILQDSAEPSCLIIDIRSASQTSSSGPAPSRVVTRRCCVTHRCAV